MIQRLRPAILDDVTAQNVTVSHVDLCCLKFSFSTSWFFKLFDSFLDFLYSDRLFRESTTPPLSSSRVIALRHFLFLFSDSCTFSLSRGLPWTGWAGNALWATGSTSSIHAFYAKWRFENRFRSLNFTTAKRSLLLELRFTSAGLLQRKYSVLLLSMPAFRLGNSDL